MLQRTNNRVNQLCVLRSLHDLPGERCWLESPRLQNMQRVQNTWSVGDGLGLNARTQM